MKCHHRKLEYSTLSGPQSNRERDLSPWLTVCGYPKDFWLMCSDRTLHAPQFTCYRCYVQMCWLKQHVQTQNGRAGELIEQKDKEGMKTNDICFILYIPLIIKHSTTLLKSMQAEIYTQSTAGFWNVLSLFILCKNEPMSPFLFILCKVEKYPLWPKEALWERQHITHTQGINPANSSFLRDRFAVTICEVRLILFNLTENFRRPLLLWRSALFGSNMPFTAPCEQWHEPLNKLREWKGISAVTWGDWLMRG